MFVNAITGAITAAGGGVAGIAAEVAAADGAGIGPVTAIMPPGAEEVSWFLAQMFTLHGALYGVTSTLGTAVNALHGATLGVSGASYEASEIANIAPLL